MNEEKLTSAWNDYLIARRDRQLRNVLEIVENARHGLGGISAVFAQVQQVKEARLDPRIVDNSAPMNLCPCGACFYTTDTDSEIHYQHIRSFTHASSRYDITGARRRAGSPSDRRDSPEGSASCSDQNAVVGRIVGTNDHETC